MPCATAVITHGLALVAPVMVLVAPQAVLALNSVP